MTVAVRLLREPDVTLGTRKHGHDRTFEFLVAPERSEERVRTLTLSADVSVDGVGSGFRQLVALVAFPFLLALEVVAHHGGLQGERLAAVGAIVVPRLSGRTSGFALGSGSQVPQALRRRGQSPVVQAVASSPWKKRKTKMKITEEKSEKRRETLERAIARG